MTHPRSRLSAGKKSFFLFVLACFLHCSLPNSELWRMGRHAVGQVWCWYQWLRDFSVLSTKNSSVSPFSILPVFWAFCCPLILLLLFCIPQSPQVCLESFVFYRLLWWGKTSALCSSSWPFLRRACHFFFFPPSKPCNCWFWGEKRSSMFVTLSYKVFLWYVAFLLMFWFLRVGGGIWAHNLLPLPYLLSAPLQK